VKSSDRSLPARGASVSDDWCSNLTEGKSSFFRAFEQEHRASYFMLGVTLNEAFAKCQDGQLSSSLQSVSLAPALCARWTEPSCALLRALADHSKHHGTLPNTAPLDPRNFQSGRAQGSARMSALISHVLLSPRSQFLRKLGTLVELIEELGQEIATSVNDLRDNARFRTETVWDLFDQLGQLHYDINTCCEEALILLKSFLVALPENQIGLFERAYWDQLRALAGPRRGLSDGRRALRNGPFIYSSRE
jgi:hypothetical protein